VIVRERPRGRRFALSDDDQIDRVERMLDDEVVDVRACFWLQTFCGCPGAIQPMHHEVFSTICVELAS